MKRRSTAAKALVGALLGVTLAVSAGGAPASLPRPGHLVFAASVLHGGLNYEPSAIFVIVPDGSGLRRIIRPPRRHADIDPAPSPDGRRILFVRVRAIQADEGEFTSDLYRVDWNGRHVHRLRRSALDESQPAWSRDGRRIAYVAADWYSHGPEAIWVAKSDGSHRRKLTNGPSATMPAWAPNARLIAYVASPAVGGPSRLMVMRPDGSHKRVVDRNIEKVGRLSWSPDGRSIYCLAAGPGGFLRVAAIAVDGAKRFLPHYGFPGQVSPSGAAIPFVVGNEAGSEPPGGELWVAPLADPHQAFQVALPSLGLQTGFDLNTGRDIQTPAWTRR